MLIPLLILSLTRAAPPAPPAGPAPRDPDTGAIAIVVRDEAGQRLPDVAVVLSRERSREPEHPEPEDPARVAPQLPRELLPPKDSEAPAKATDASGRVSFGALAPGRYRVRIVADGYEVIGSTHVSIEAGKTISRSYTLKFTWVMPAST